MNIYADPLTQAIQRLNANPYNLTKDECIQVVRELRAELAAPKPAKPDMDLERLRYALGDGKGKLTASQLTRRAYELFQKAAKWDEWHEAQNRVEAEMPEGWAFVIQCSPGDWDIYLTDPDGERVDYDRDCETLAQQMNSAVDEARAATSAT